MNSKEILQNINLLKKYHHNLVYDYTEYPTKGIWDQAQSGQDYANSFVDWASKNPNAPVLFYVHTPFCEQLCYFCLCSKEITQDYQRVSDYLYDYLFKEIDLIIDLCSKQNIKLNVKEIYFGGGSPTFYHEPEFKALVDKLNSLIDFDNVKSFTVEVDPRRVDIDKLKFYHSCGVNRLSFGVQDFDPLVQERINRAQPPELLRKLLTPEVRELFPEINFDLLVGLPGQTVESITQTLKEVVELGPDQIQPLYMHYKPETRSYMVRMVKNGPLPDFYERKELFVEVVDQLLAGGYHRAGFENFAKPNNRLAVAMKDNKATYNSIGTVDGEALNFVAVGSSAHGVLGEDYYYQNYYEHNLYHEALDKGEFPVYRGYKLTSEDKLRRDIIKSIRIFFTLDFSSVEEKHSVKFREHFEQELDVLKEFERDGLVEIHDDRLSLTETGKHFSPQVCSVFDEYLERPHFNSKIVANAKV
jgi:oxygen-independent coproporphyrinogen III oxidase